VDEKLKLKKVAVYTQIGIFFAKFSEFDNAVLMMTSLLTKVNFDLVEVLQYESPISARIKVLKEMVENSDADDEKKVKIKSLLNKFNSQIVPFRNKLAHASHYGTSEGFDIGRMPSILRPNEEKSARSVIDLLPSKIEKYIEIASEFVQFLTVSSRK